MTNYKEEFFKCATKYAQAMESLNDNLIDNLKDRSKNGRVVNNMIDKMKIMYKQAYAVNKLAEIEEFMSHENKYIRFITATYSLLSNSKIAEDVLNKLIDLPIPNYVASNARLTLDLWKKGYLDPEKF